MMLQPDKILASILERIAEPGDQPEAVFLSDEVRRWPANILQALQATRLLNSTLPAEMISCFGCEERCLRPVTVLASGLAISSCHLYAHMGPFSFGTGQLERWTSSRRLFAVFLGGALHLNIRNHDDRWRRIRFGDVQVEGLRRGFSLEFQSTAMAAVGSLRVPLSELLHINGRTVTPDWGALAMAAFNSEDLQSGNRRVQRSSTVREDSKLLTAIKYRRVQLHMEVLAREHPRLNKEQLARRLARSTDGEGMSWARIARITRIPSRK